MPNPPSSELTSLPSASPGQPVAVPSEVSPVPPATESEVKSTEPEFDPSQYALSPPRSTSPPKDFHLKEIPYPKNLSPNTGFATRGEITGIGLRPQQNQIVCSTKQRDVFIYDLASGDELACIKSPDLRLSQVSGISRYADVIVIGADLTELRTFSLSSSNELVPLGSYKGHNLSPMRVICSDNGEHICSVGERGDLHIWKSKVFDAKAFRINSKSSRSSVHFSQDSSKLLVVDSTGFQVYDANNGKQISKFQLPLEISNNIAVLPDFSGFFAMERVIAGPIRLWKISIETGQAEPRKLSTERGVTSLTLNGDASQLLIGLDNRISVTSCKLDRELYQIPLAIPIPSLLQIHPNENLLIASDQAYSSRVRTYKVLYW